MHTFISALGEAAVVDINEGGTKILSTGTATSISDGTEIIIDIAQVGSSMAGVSLKSYSIGTK